MQTCLEVRCRGDIADESDTRGVSGGRLYQRRGGAEMIYAVIDTNFLVATLFPRYQDSATARVVRAVFEGRIIPVKSNGILEKYRKVFMRPYVHFAVGTMEPIFAVIESHGVELSPRSVDFDFPDESDRVFFEVAFSGESLRAMELVRHGERVFVSHLQRNFGIGYVQATQVCELLDERGLLETGGGN